MSNEANKTSRIILLGPSIQELYEKARIFQAQRQTLPQGNNAHKLQKQLEKHYQSIQDLISDIQNDINLIDQLKKQKRGKRQQRSESHNKRIKSRKDIFSIHNYQDPSREIK